MDTFVDLLACPACSGPLSSAWRCSRCDVQFTETSGVVQLRLPGDRPTEAVRAFYEQTPFPGYPPHDSLSGLRARAERSLFASMLDRAIDADARIVDVGC